MIFKITSKDVEELYTFAKKSISSIDVQIKNAVSSLFALFGSLTTGVSSNEVKFVGLSDGGMPIFVGKKDKE